ncbi:MAG: DUF262 domain-containing protein [Sedimentisphaerales bacterium]|jgi:5-methylcytosine-specific restriction endonuclease McrA
MTLKYEPLTKPINDIVLLYQHGQINLKPGFQRKSVWSWRDRQRLIQSIVAGYPLPNIFLYCRDCRGKPVYDVIDGKQRLETLFMFLGVKDFKKDWFDVKLDLDEDGLRWWNWNEIKRHHSAIRHEFERCRIQTIEVYGELAEIIDLFVRINSTGKRLTSGEKRHAKFYDSSFLKEAERLTHKFKRYLLEYKILSRAQIDRMKGTELFSELLMSIHKGGIINKKTALDRAISNDEINGNTLHRIAREFVKTLNLVKKMLPDLKQTRLKNTAEFYSLFIVVWDMQQHGLVLSDRRRNKMAFALLRKLSTGVDELRDKYRHAKDFRPRPPYSDYLLTVQGDTDSAATRERRAKILRGLLEPIFESKDSKRSFSPEQRRILWNTDVAKKCVSCHRKLTWDDFTIDHVIAHTRGGLSRVENARLMCRSCNSRKGAK